jgi:transporter family-2 protein
MIGVLYAMLAGLFVSLQNVFNTRVSEKVGLIEATAVVHGIGFAVAVAAVILWGSGNIKGLQEVNKLYLLAGVFGVVIVFSAMKGISLLGATYTIAVLMVTQLIAASIIDAFGLFGMPEVKMVFTKPIGIAIMIVGIIIFNIKG